MDIRRKTTFLSRNIDGRPSHNYSSFFQSSQRKTMNVNPESGMHLVGPMFELTACVELKGDEEDFDAVYRDSSLSFGPTICSFGLKYNDHNYAVPSGLTPPSMAPHLMDVCRPRERCSPDPRSGEASACLEGNANTPYPSSSSSASTALQSVTDASASDPHLVTPSKDNVAGPWGRKDPCPGDVTSEIDSPGARSGKLAFQDLTEMRYEAELKVIEVPEELAVSPSQLSDLDSDASGDEGYPMEKNVRALVVDGGALNDIWSCLRCPCGNSQNKTRLIKCLQCNLYQHVHCMESFYHTTLPNLAIGYTCIECNTDVVATIPGVPRFAAPVEAVITATAASDENLTACGSGNFTTLPTVDESMASVESESGLSIDGGHEEATKRLAINQGTVGAQYVEAAADRAKRLGLIPSSISKVSDTRDSGWLSEKHGTSRSKELDVGPRPGWNAVDWEKLNEISRSARRTAGDTNVNLRMPSPPRASKRKQDLTSTSYNDNDVQVSDPEKKSCTTAGSGATVGSTDDFSSNNTTPISTPSLTPFKGHPSGTPTSTPGRTLTPCSEFSSSPGLDSPVHTRSRGEKRRHKPSRVLFPDSSNPNKRGFGAHANPLGAAWAKDYQEAENNAYTKALLDHVEERISANLERNYRIPPSCLTRSSLCRVVLFDHDDKGLEASIRLSPSEVVTEVRGQFLLLEEYEHYVDPVSEYNRYVLFYNGFGERGVVIDATQYGNSARFIRRSCIPNCRLEHYVVQGKLLVVVRTSTEVTSGTELTIPFDLDYQACRYPLDCACARSRCPVLKWRRKLLRNKVVPNLDYSKYIESQLRVLSKPLSQESPNSRVDSCLSGSPLMKASLGTSSLPGSPSSFSMPFSMNRVNPALGSRSPLSGAPIMLSSSARSVRPGTSYEGLDDRVARSARYHPSPDSVTTGAHSPLHENTFKSLSTSNPSVSAPSTVTDENERPDEAMLSGSASSEPETAQSDNKINPESPCHNSGPHTTFESIITTRRQAAAMRNALQ